jgi:hypothetical protein
LVWDYAASNDIGDKGMIEVVKFCRQLEFLKLFNASIMVIRK